MTDKQKQDVMAEDRLKFYRTAGLAALKIIPDDKCCQLLAWLYVYGGGNEQVLNHHISDMIFYAQGRLNLLGGETPDVGLLPVLQGYVKSLTDGNYNNPPEWVIELEKEYGIKPQRKNKK
jgi:hypothetical protein